MHLSALRGTEQAPLPARVHCREKHLYKQAADRQMPASEIRTRVHVSMANIVMPATPRRRRNHDTPLTRRIADIMAAVHAQAPTFARAKWGLHRI